MKNQSVLVTGVRGRVGAAIALELAADNDVHGLSRSGARARGHLERAGVTFHKLGLGADSLDALPDHFDYIFHQAVTWGVTNDDEQTAAYNASVKGVLQLLKKYGPTAKRIVLGSTGGVCAESPDPVKETALRLPDGNPYHSYKFAMEVIGEAVGELDGIDVVNARYYWPWSAHNGFPHTWVIVPMLRGEPVSIRADRPNPFTPIFMPDCVRYSIALAEAGTCTGSPEGDRCVSPDSAPRVLNITGSEVATLVDMANIVGELLGVEPTFSKDREEQFSFLGDASLCTRLYGPPEYDTRRSLETAVDWHRQHPDEHKQRAVFDAPRNW